VTETAVELKAGDLVKFKPWVTQEHLRMVWLLYDLDEVAKLHRCTFRVDETSNHDGLGRIAYLTFQGSDNPGRWGVLTFMKVCCLERVE